MGERICSIEDCPRKVLARGWCPAHYSRWKRTGGPQADTPVKQPGPSTCFVDGCARKSESAGMCEMHRKRWRKYGDPLMVQQHGGIREPRFCEVEGCRETHIGLGFCEKHLRRFKKYGDPAHEREVPTGGSHYAWTEEPSYGAAHGRIKRQRGPASDYGCVDCDGSAADWSYNGGAPDEMVENDLPYSLDAGFYVPRCKSCHRFHDNEVRHAP